MSKIDLSDVSSGYNRSKINSNFQKIEDELNQKVLYRDSPDGEANQMEVELDMNSNPINNLPIATEQHQAVPKGQMEQYIQANASGLIANFREEQVGVAGQTTIVLTELTYVPNVNNVSLYINGVRQARSAYTEVSGTALLLAAPLEGGETLEIIINAVTETTVTVDSSIVTYDGDNVKSALDERILTVDSVADLSGLVGKYEGQQVSVKGYHAGSAVGGGIFYWDGTRTAENDGGVVIGGWVRILDGYVTPEMFGAVGDGVTDDTFSSQAALEVGLPVTGEGTYLVGSLSVPSYARLKKLELVAKAGITSGGILVLQDDAIGCILEGCKIEGNKGLQVSTVNGIVATGRDHKFARNTITDVSGSGFSLVPPFNYSEVSHNTVLRPDRRGITHELSLTEKSCFVRILHNVIEDTGSTGISLISGLEATGESSAGCVDWIIDGNLVSNTGLLVQAGAIGGYSANNERIVISRNTMKNVGNHGSHVGGSNIRVEGNVMEDIANSGVLVRNFPNSGGTGAPLCTDVTVLNNTIRNVAGLTSANNGITIANCENFAVRGNQVEGIRNVGIKIEGLALGNPIVTKNGMVDGNYVAGAGAAMAGSDFSEGILVINSHCVSVTGNVVEASHGANIKVKSVANVTVSANVVSESVAGDGILVWPGSPATNVCAVVGNTSTGNSQHGVRLTSGSSYVSCVGNVSTGNGVGSYLFGTLTFSTIGLNAPT